MDQEDKSDFHVDIEVVEDTRGLLEKRKKLTLRYGNDVTTCVEDYQIAICQDGKFAVTFDTANLRIRILENTDYRPLAKKKNNIEVAQQNDNESDEINKTVAYFKINHGLDIDHLYGTDHVPQSFNAQEDSSSTETKIEEKINHGSDFLSANTTENKESKFRWSLDISNIQQHEIYSEYSIFVAVSRIDVEEDMKRKKGVNYRKGKLEKKEYSIEKMTNQEETTEHIILSETKRTAIYCLKLNEKEANYDLSNVTFYYSDSVTGICRFVNKDLDEDFENNIEQYISRFTVLNIHGIYSYNCDDVFNLNNKFNYPEIIKDELEYYHKEKDCTDKLLTCLYNQYFLVAQYEDNVQVLEVYSLAEMELKTIAKQVESKHIRKYNRNTFSISKLQLCFTRGLNSIELYLMDNGLETASKRIDGIEKIHSLEFIDSDNKLLIIGEDSEDEDQKIIIWDLYNTEKVDEPITLDNFLTIKDLTTHHLAKNSGNLLKVDDKGNVISLLKKIEIELKLKQEQIDKESKLKKYEKSKKLDENHHNIYFDESIPNFKSIVDEKEPWVMDDYENYQRNSFCLKATEIETLQLIVGRSTVQIWHQIHSDLRNTNEFPNKGEPFLEYIWTNDIPVYQERKGTRLRIKEMKYGSNDFCLKVYWYESDLVSKTNGDEIVRYEKTIRMKYIDEKAKAVKHACEALKHLNKRRKFLKNNYIRIHKYEEMVTHIQHIIWRFVVLKPNQFRLLDVRYNVMKNLILGDCNHLIKFILFGYEENEKYEKYKKEPRIIHIPRNILWAKFIKGGDYDYLNRNKPNKHDDLSILRLENNLELAICNCKGRGPKEAIIVAYLLEYYSRHATNDLGWMSTLSKAFPLLLKYNYDDYIKRLLDRECFANQNYFSAKNSQGLNKYMTRSNNVTKFIALGIDDKYKWYNGMKLFNNDPWRPHSVGRVPLPEFTRHKIKQNKVEYGVTKIILNILWFVFIPRWYKIGRNQNYLLSPFSRTVLYENNNDIYDNPAIEAVIDFRWQKAKNYFYSLFLRFLIFFLCFGLISWVSLDRNVNINEGLLFALIAIFYYSAIYLFVTELLQLYYHGPIKYFDDIFNWFDIFTIIIPVIVMVEMHKNLQFSRSDDTGYLIAGISISTFLLWIEGILYLRLFPKLAIHIYRPIIIFKTVYPLFSVILFVVIAFAHTLYILINHSKNISTKHSTLSGIATNIVTNEKLDIQLQSDFNVFTLMASVVLVIILQNMLIAYMSGEFDKSESKTRQIILRYRANQVAEYEALCDIYFHPHKPEPKYINYIGHYKYFEEWYKNVRKHNEGPIYQDFEEERVFTKYTFEKSDYDEYSIWNYED